jgi:hypothetical protein
MSKTSERRSELWEMSKGQLVDALFEKETSLDALAHELAAEHAKSVIESESLYGEIEGEERWLCFDSVPPWCEKEVRYLEARKLLRHHPNDSNLVQIVEE